MTNPSFTRTVLSMESYAKCPFLRVCGYCSLMEQPYEKQLELQSKYLHMLFSRYTPFVEPVIGMRAMEGFQNLVTVSFGLDWRGMFATGIYRPQQKQFLALQTCMLRNPLAERIVRTIKRLAFHYGIADSFPATQVVIRVNRNQEQVSLLFSFPAQMESSFVAFLHTLRREHPQIVGIAITEGMKNPSIFWGHAAIEETLCGLNFSLPPASDFPSVPLQAEVLYAKAMEIAQVHEGEVVIDCCTMHGMFALLSAKAGAKQVFLIQEHTPYCDEAKKNGLVHILRFVGNNERHLRQLAKRRVPCGMLFLSPSEEGCERSLLDSVITIGPDRIVYLSRHARTLERDMRYLLQNGFYQVKQIQGVDMHPHSSNMQIIASFERTLVIRPLQESERILLRSFLYEAIYVPEGEPSPQFSILEEPSLLHYFEGFGKEGDVALAADIQGKIVGIVWVRLFSFEDPGYGFLNETTPELVISLEKPYRGKGIGRLLLETMVHVLKNAGYKNVSLSVQKQNRAFSLYKKLGFSVLIDRGEECLMVRDLV